MTSGVTWDWNLLITTAKRSLGRSTYKATVQKFVTVYIRCKYVDKTWPIFLSYLTTEWNFHFESFFGRISCNYLFRMNVLHFFWNNYREVKKGKIFWWKEKKEKKKSNVLFVLKEYSKHEEWILYWYWTDKLFTW